MKRRTKLLLAGAGFVALVVGIAVILNFKRLVPVVGSVVNRARVMAAPKGTITTE